MKPLLSIVIPSNNKTELLDEAITSIIYDPSWNDECELCISDNSKGESTKNLVMSKYNDNQQISYRRSLDAPSLDENVSMAVSMAKGQYVWIFGDDDIIEKNFISYLLLYLKNNKVDIAILNSSSFDESGEVEKTRRSFNKVVVYGQEDNDRFLVEQSAYITYVACIVIRKKLWLKFFRKDKIGSYFAHIDAVCRAKIGHSAHFLPNVAIRMRLHTQTWTAKHFEIWNVFFPEIIWELENYSSLAKANVIPRYPLKSIKRILASRAYGRFNITTYKVFLFPSKNSSGTVKALGFLICIMPREIFRFLFIFYILIFKKQHNVKFSPKLALSQLKRRK